MKLFRCCSPRRYNKVFAVVVPVVLASMLFGCAVMDRNLLFRDRGVNVVSCPTGVDLIVDGQTCTTPCTLSLPVDTVSVNVSYFGQATVVPLNKSALNSYELTGTLFVLDPYKLGKPSDSPDSVYFIRDSVGLADVCGTATQPVWVEPVELSEPYYEEDFEETEGSVDDLEPITTPLNQEEAPAQPAPGSTPDVGTFSDPELGIVI